MPTATPEVVVWCVPDHQPAIFSQPTSAWGGEGRYYAHGRPSAQEDTGTFLRDWYSAVGAAMPGAREAVESAVKQWNSTIRDHLRNETGLRLSQGSEVQAVPVRVQDGIPAPLLDLLKGLEKWALLVLNRTRIEQAVAGVGFLAAQYDALSRVVPPMIMSKATQYETLHTRDLAAELLGLLHRLKVREKWQQIREDVLGAYLFRIPEIHIYWLPIAIAAAAEGTSVHAVTQVVLAHELAHAYTHLGRDIDGSRWDTDSFSLTHHDIIEGLAEYYAGVVSDRLASRAPEMPIAYERLQAMSGGPYVAHKRWIADRVEPGEVVRLSLVETRKKGIQDLDEFEFMIEEGWERLHSPKP